MARRTLVLPDFARYFFTLIIAAILILFAWVISPFFNILVYSSLVVVIFYPLYKYFLRISRRRQGISAFLSTILVTLLVLIPLALFVIFLAQEAVTIYGFLTGKWIAYNVDGGLQWSGLNELPVVGPWLETFGQSYGFSDFIHSTNIDLIQVVQEVGKVVANFLVAQSGNILGAVSSTVLYVLIFLITIFFLFRDGVRFVERLKFLSPLPAKYEVEIERKLMDTVYGIVMGNFGSSFLQAIAAGIGFAIAGVNNIIFWSTMVAFTSLIPYMGAAIIWLPIAISFAIRGEMEWAIFLVLWGICVVSLVDNVARPILIGSRTSMHPLLTFLVVLGGIFLFGLKGIIFGPLILSLTITILHIYQMEYEDMLKD